MIKFLLSRYITYAFIFLEVLLVPLVLKKSIYVEYEYIKNIINISSFVLLGSHTGYVYYFYSKKQNLFPELFKVNIYILLFTSILFSVYCKSAFLYLTFFCFGVSVFVEKKMQVEKEFYLAMLYKPFLAFALILAVIFLKDTSISLILSVGYSVALILWFLVIRLFARNLFGQMFSLKLIIIHDDLYKYLSMVKVGIVENAATIILSFYLFTDRFILVHFYKDQLPSYSLAFNFSQFVFIGVNSIAYLLNVEIGENIESMKLEKIIQIFGKVLFFFVLLLLVVFSGSFIYTKMFTGFDNLIIYTVLLSSFIGIFYVCNILSIIPLLKGKQKVLTIVIGLLFLINVFISALFFKFNISPLWGITKSVLLLASFGIYIVSYSIVLIRRTNI